MHLYHINVTWTGNRGLGTKTYSSYGRDHVIVARGKPQVMASADPSFRGDPERYNPEELLVASLSACHMLWYLHLCATNGIVVVDYRDEAHGSMTEEDSGGGHFTSVILRPVVKIERGDRSKALSLHENAHELCFIANSVTFPVLCKPTLTNDRTETEQWKANAT